MAQLTAQKLGITPEATIVVLGQPLSQVSALLGPLPDGASIVDDAVSADIVLLFADDVAAVMNSARPAMNRLDAGGRIWIAYRKGANRKTPSGEPAPLHRDTMQAALAELGLDGVTLISIDDTWSAMRVKAV